MNAKTEDRLLIVDDDVEVAQYFGHVAERLGYAVTLLDQPGEFMTMVESVNPGVIVLDLQMPKRDGIELLRELGRRGSRAQVYIASGLDSRVVATAEELGRSLGLSMAGSFCKPITPEELEALLGRHIHTQRTFTADELGEAIANGQLVVHYLPKATRTGTGRWLIEGAEALVRWQHDEHGLLYPGEFLELAEESGHIVALTDYVFRSAMQQASLWLEKGLYMELGLNLSAEFLRDLEFPDRLLAMIHEHRLDPSMVTLELAETSAMLDPDVTMDILARLRVKRVNLCLDDFGVGHSSLTHLYRMPFSEVKLDNAFIADVGRNEDARALVEGLLYLAKKLKMRACAEGVEDEATLNLLERLGCDKVQGHHIGRAMRASELAQAVKAWNGRLAPGDLSAAG